MNLTEKLSQEKEQHVRRNKSREGKWKSWKGLNDMTMMMMGWGRRWISHWVKESWKSVKWVVGLMGKWRILRISAPKSFIAESPTWEMPQMEASQLLRTQKVSWDGETSQQATTQPTTMVTNLLTCQNKKRKIKWLIGITFIRF